MSFFDHALSSLTTARSPADASRSTMEFSPTPLTPWLTAGPSQVPPFPTMAATNSTSSGGSRAGAENGECKLLGPFALFVQGALGALALLSLVYKRWRERPQRPVKIWAFDASKQVVGSALLHIANLLMSMLSSGDALLKAEHYQANPCSFYLLNLAIDVSILEPLPFFPMLISLQDYHRHSDLDCTSTSYDLRVLPNTIR